jgi:hypothetical protein
MSISLKFADSAIGNLIGSYDSSYAYKHTHSMEINGTAGRILLVIPYKAILIKRLVMKWLKYGRLVILMMLIVDLFILLISIWMMY